MGTVAAGEGFPVAILNRNEPAFYCVPARAFKAPLNRLEDAESNAVADARAGEAVVTQLMAYELSFLDSALKEWRKLYAQTQD